MLWVTKSVGNGALMVFNYFIFTYVILANISLFRFNSDIAENSGVLRSYRNIVVLYFLYKLLNFYDCTFNNGHQITPIILNLYLRLMNIDSSFTFPENLNFSVMFLLIRMSGMYFINVLGAGIFHFLASVLCNEGFNRQVHNNQLKIVI